MALTTAEKAYFTDHKTNVLADVTAIFSGLTTTQLRDITCCALALGLMNRNSSDSLGNTFSEGVTVPLTLPGLVYDFVEGTSGDYMFPQHQTDLIPINTRLAYRWVLSLINLYDYTNQAWEGNISASEILTEITSLFNRSGHSATNGWQKLFNNELNLSIQDEASLSITNPHLPASTRWGLVTSATTDYQQLHSYEVNVESSVTGGTNTRAISLEQAYSGFYSVKVTYSNSKLLLRQGASSLSTSTAYTVSAWVYLPSNWDGGDIAINALNFTDIVEGTSSPAVDTTLGSWQRVSRPMTTVTDTTGDWEIRCADSPSDDRTMYVDYVTVTDGTTVWDATALSNDTRWESISYLSQVYRDYQYLSNTLVTRVNLNDQNLDEVGVAIRNLQGFDKVYFKPDMQFIDSTNYLSTEFKSAGTSRSFRELTLIKAIEGREYITW